MCAAASHPSLCLFPLSALPTHGPPRVLPRLTRAQIFVWTVEKFGCVNADILYYRKIANLVHARWGMGCVPSHGKTLGDERDLATIIKNRFENGRRSNAQFIYRSVPVSRINLCADGLQLVQQVRISPGLAARGASLFLVRARSSANAPAPSLRRLPTTACQFATPQGLHVHVDQPDVDIADDSADDSATPAAPHVTLKPFNPARDARRALRSVYAGDPVLEDVVEVRATPARTHARTLRHDLCVCTFARADPRRLEPQGPRRCGCVDSPSNGVVRGHGHDGDATFRFGTDRQEGEGRQAGVRGQDDRRRCAFHHRQLLRREAPAGVRGHGGALPPQSERAVPFEGAVHHVKIPRARAVPLRPRVPPVDGDATCARDPWVHEGGAADVCISAYRLLMMHSDDAYRSLIDP